ncbi:hypothetical protein H2O64_01880 [Kordia sp. YSTF-M3]|uniref:Uncharacterized protein n=1 Tax=Kordia aestuariivivens TaxID=2759037 RepID=A0ABR7Q4B6_9FLAO|nr:hypothetical protein [Kordia aestuariivivens]MBC8753401.1 hypothetical protein [Kordia aestuariivivens]
MNFKDADFYETNAENKKQLKKEYLIAYSFSPGLYDDLRKINLFLDNDLNYQLFVFFYEQPKIFSEEINEELVKKSRTFIQHQSKLPSGIRTLIHQFLAHSEASLKTSYYNNKNLFGILDRTEKYYEIRYNDVYYSIEMGLDCIDKKLFVTEVDQLFLQLTAAIENWLQQLIDGFVFSHNEN